MAYVLFILTFLMGIVAGACLLWAWSWAWIPVVRRAIRWLVFTVNEALEPEQELLGIGYLSGGRNLLIVDGLNSKSQRIPVSNVRGAPAFSEVRVTISSGVLRVARAHELALSK